jgi:CheY-like chemotaxis protein
MKRHVDVGCPEEVNIPQLLAKKLIDMQSGTLPNVTRATVTVELEKAEKEVVGMIAGIFDRFEASSIFKEYIKIHSRKVSTMQVGDRLGKNPSLSTNKAIIQSSILLYEKHPLTRTILSHILASRGYTVITVADSISALAALNEDTFDIVLVNYELPRSDALEFMDQHKKSVDSKNSKFICMVSDPSKAIKKNCLTAGYSSVVSKPFSMEDFEAAKIATKGSISKVMAGFTSMLD